MKKRKLLSVATAGALVAAQMVMPVMAAGGTVNADITTKNAVIRVQVPTKLEVAVDEFEMVGDGSQINSGEFFIKNHSSVAVNVKTTSTVTAGANTTLKTTKAGVVEDATGKGNAWLAVAAQTEANKYGSGTIGDLTDASSNVATVDPTTGKAEQEFYLAKGTGNIEYKLLDASGALPETMPSYVAEYLKLAELAVAADGAQADGTTTIFNAADTDGSATKKNDDILKELLAAQDIYAVDASKNVTKLTSADAATTTYAAANKYYKAGAAQTTAPVANDGVFVYAEQATAGGATAFRFIGKLSTGKNGGWTKNDFSTITIAYDVTGVQASAYDEVVRDCVYGLYTAPTAPSITSNKSVATAAGTKVDFTVDLGAGSKGASGIASVTTTAFDGYDLLNDDGDVVYEDGKLTFPAETIDYLLSDTTVTWPMTITVTFTMNDTNAEAVEETLTLTK